jgi:general secretion pathway protein G
MHLLAPVNRAAPMRQSAGFTLIELLITVAIVALLASVALPLSELSVQRGKEQELSRSLREIRTAIDAYKRHVDEGRISRAADESGYPPNLAILVEGVVDAKSPVRAKIRFLRRIPRDPFGSDTQTPADQTWGLRSYDSPHDAPRPGKDVFDIYSLNTGSGLNGVPYKDW